MKRIISCIFVLIMAFSVFAACGDDSEDYGDKILLHVGIYDGGWGTEWLDKVIEDFERDYPEYKVIADKDKKYSFSILLGSIDTILQDVFIGPVYLYDYISQDKLMDITDVMTTPLSEQLVNCDEDATIKSKMWSDLDDFYSGYRGENRYYAIPFGGGIYSINYDIDLFNEKSLFIGKGTAAPNITWVNESGERSVGPDGIEGTYDDGLPVTYDDFKMLLNKMKASYVTPFIWSSTEGYVTNFLYSLAASYEGKENFDILKKMSGEYTFEGDTQPTIITEDNAYLLQNMTGKKKALQFAYDIVKGGYFHDQSGALSMDFKTAQDTFLMSVELSKYGSGNRIAFLIDGAHWYHEAYDTLNEMADKSDEYKNRRFGIMPFPKFEGSPATKPTYFASSFYSAVFARKNAKRPEIAKKFIAYLHTDRSLQTCTEISGMVRPLNYEMPQETLNRMPVYYQSLWYAYADNSDIVYHTVNNPRIYENEAFFEGEWKWSARSQDGKVFNNPISAFRTYPSLTVDEYMDALKFTFNQSYWNTKVLKK